MGRVRYDQGSCDGEPRVRVSYRPYGQVVEGSDSFSDSFSGSFSDSFSFWGQYPEDRQLACSNDAMIMQGMIRGCFPGEFVVEGHSGLRSL